MIPSKLIPPALRFVLGILLAVITLGCPPSRTTVVGYPPGPSPSMVPGGGTHIVMRDAAGCSSCVTVAVTAIPGPLPDLSAPPPSPVVVAYLANAGEGGRNEKRYNLKPSSQAGYELQLSADGNRIRWTILERMVGSATRVQHRTGHLAWCDSIPHFPSERDINFKNCVGPIAYDPIETAAIDAKPLQLAFASFASSPLGEQPIPLPFPSRWVDAIVSSGSSDTPGWVSCKSGCCTLAQ
jgi:hypothetical protein